MSAPLPALPPDSVLAGLDGFGRRRGWSLGGWIGIGLTVGVALVALAAPLLAPVPPGRLDLAASWQPPSLAHPFGTGDNGVDVLANVVYGARISLGVGLAAVLLSGLFGTLLGMALGWLGGAWDEAAMRVVDVLLAFPGLLLAIFITAVIGPSLPGLVLALCATAWVSYARLARAQVQSLRQREFILAARALGASPWRIAARHLLPNLLAPLVVQATFGLPGVILAEASLSFLGLGVPPGTPSWGALVDQGTAHLWDAPHVALFPGAAIALATLGFNFLGEALRDRLDPRA
ncbi:MAG: ABC transporter permease [Myxococcales bacterium]